MSNTRFVLRAMIFSLAGSVLVFLGVGMLLADQWQISTSRLIAAEPSRLAPLLTDLNTWPKWSAVEFQLGPPTRRSVVGEPGTVGHGAVWEGPIGRATFAFSKVESGLLEYSITYEYAQEGGTWGGKLTGAIAWVGEGDGCRVTWRERGELDSLVQRWSNWFGALQEKVREVQGSSLSGLAIELQPASGDKQR